VWGVGFGPYFVVPILGPSSVRDGTGLIVDAFAFLPWQIPKWADFDHRVTWQWSLTGLDLIQTRANLLDASNILEEAALDRYAFVRDAYFQRRRYLIYDGDPPPLPARPESARATPPAGPVAPGAISLVPVGSPPPPEPAPSGTVLVTTPLAPEASRPTESAPTAEEPTPQPGQADVQPPPEPARESEASPLAAPPSIGPLVEPQIPVNYQAVLAADAPRAVAAR
jgi:phospholipid-binding lipoprotein MlaA